MEGKSGKNDATDVAAICEAASRPGMRFVPVKPIFDTFGAQPLRKSLI